MKQLDLYPDDDTLRDKVIYILDNYWVSEEAQYKVFEEIKQQFLKAGYVKGVRSHVKLPRYHHA